MNVAMSTAEVEAVRDTVNNRRTTPAAQGIAADRLRSIVERIERLEGEKRDLASDVKDIYAEAKSAGFDSKVLRRLIATRKMEAAEVEEQETMLDLYRRALRG